MFLRIAKMKLFKWTVLALFLAALSLRADQMIPFTIEELSTNAQLIVHGTVIGKTVQSDPQGRIYTSLELAVAEVWKGKLATNHIIIVRGGGILGDEAQEVSGEADYEIGEELVSFLVFNVRHEALSFGMAQGKFHVWADPTGVKLARNAVHGVKSRSSRATSDRLTLADLKQRVTGGGK
jgi:hypothetical protein